MTTTLTKQQRLFVDSYAGDIVEAMQTAGYQGSETYLRQYGSRLLADPKIMECLKDRSRFMTKRKSVIATREHRQAWWTDIMYNRDPHSKPAKDKHGNPLPEELQPDIPIQQRLKASELLGKSEGDFVDRLEIDSNITLTQIVMNSYKKPEEDDGRTLEDIEAEYRRVRDHKRLAEATEEEEENQSADSPYSSLI